ncbi:hypothetical protein BJX99DRAFT_261610 [Aspergillus californicus]
MELASDPYNLPSRVSFGKDESLITTREFSSGHSPRQNYPLENPPIRQRRRHGSSVLAWGKDHLPLKSILPKERLDDDEPLHILDTRPSPEHSTDDTATERRSSRIHLSRSNDRLKPCDCPSQGPLCTTPSISTTTTGDDVDAAAQKTTPGSKSMEWANGLEKQATTITHDSVSASTSTALSGSNTSQSDLYSKKSPGVDCRSSIIASSLNEPVMTIQYASTITTNDERRPGTANKTIPRKPVSSQPSRNSSISTPSPSLLYSPEREKRERIERLEKRKCYLARRRVCIEKALHGLMWHSRPCSTLDFMKAHEEIKKTTTRLYSDLDEVRRKEHEISLDLFRILRSQDEKDYCGGGSASLWVSRVTR